MKLMASGVHLSAAMHEVALVLTILIIDEDHHLASGDIRDRVGDCRQPGARLDLADRLVGDFERLLEPESDRSRHSRGFTFAYAPSDLKRTPEVPAAFGGAPRHIPGGDNGPTIGIVD